jgi:tRNA U34 2-thiouridine synthase MnmA/TrmU
MQYRMEEMFKNNLRRKAVGLFSGGLDSALAVRIIAGLGYDVTAIMFDIPFCKRNIENCLSQYIASDNFVVQFRQVSLKEDFVELVRNPRFGYGKNMNICIDCRIYMLKRARLIMEEIGADFVFTGEVLGQRPMSQNINNLRLIEKQSGLEGRLLRPLSAQLLKPTVAEQNGWINREELYNIEGRSRKRQMKLADIFGIKKYPTPAGGCLLTDECFSARLRDAFNHNEDSLKELTRLKYGRHYRLKDGTKVICGRTDKENLALMKLGDPPTPIFAVKNYSSTVAFLFGNLIEENKLFAGGLTAHYSKVKNEPSVEIEWWIYKDGESSAQVFFTRPLSEEELKSMSVR